MTSVMTPGSAVEPFVAPFESLAGDPSAPAPIQSLRRAAFDRFSELGFPTTKNEDWHYTSVAPIVEHEASTSKIGEDQIFYLKQRGLSAEQAVSMIVSGFCKEVFKELPMEFALEAQQLLGITLEGSVG